jgi:hypothetical protein
MMMYALSQWISTGSSPAKSKPHFTCRSPGPEKLICGKKVAKFAAD